MHPKSTLNCVCDHCGRDFHRKPSHVVRSTSHYCSVACRRAAESIEVACDHCGKTFRKKASAATTMNFCSVQCRRDEAKVELVCETCGTPFTIVRNLANRRPRRFCSNACYIRKSHHPSIEERLRRFVDTPDGPDGCWVFTGHTNRGGYGVVSRNGATQLAHRVSWELAHGPIPDGVLVLHRCDNPPCVNPAHLFLGTHQDNSDDKIAKGRQAVGESVITAKLTDSDVLTIRARYAQGNVSYAELATEYGVSDGHIGYVVNRQRWKHI